MPLTNPAQVKFIAEVTRLLHADKLREAALAVSEFSELKLKIESDSPAECYPVLEYLLHWLLGNNGMEEAAQLLWSPRLFNPNPKYTRDIWNLFDSTQLGLIMGSASTSKSYSLGVRLFLEWLRDPAWTRVMVIGPSEAHLTANLFSHLVALHGQAKLPMPGTIGELFIGLDRRNLQGSISGIIIPISNTKKAGRIQGVKRKPRPETHPVFGDMSRLFLFIDELESVPGGLWSDLDNIVSNVGEEGDCNFKILGAFNPANQHGETGKRCEPPEGWNTFDPDKTFRWKSTRGWDVLRLDGLLCENVVEKRVIYPGLQTAQGIEQISRNAGGRSSPGWFSMARGCFPPAGIEMAMIPAGMLARCRGEFVWLEQPKPVGAVDLALEGGASAVFSKGSYGLATGMKMPPSIEYPQGRTIMFKDSAGHSMSKPGLLLETQMALPKGDTVVMKDSVIAVCRKSGIRPEFFALDRTGNGAGVCDLIKHEWSASVHDLNLSQSASETKIMAEDNEVAKEGYDRLSSELWGALNKFMEFGVLLIHPQVSMEHLSGEITQRRYRNVGGRIKIESKADYFSRGHRSPDSVDSLCLMIHAVRKGFSVVPSMTGVADLGASDDDWGWGEDQCRIDASNRTETLNISM